MTPFQSILAAWAVLVLVLVGLGALVGRACGIRLARGDDWLRAFWLGWIATIGVLQVWQTFQPVDDAARIGLGVVGAIGLVSIGAAAWGRALRGVGRHAPAVVVATLLAVWLGQRCLAGPSNGDSGFYHIPTVRWLLAYPVVPGLANLFAALAYNQSYFLWVAALDVGPFAHRSEHLANGILVVVLLAQVVLALSRLLRPGRACRPRDLFSALVLPAVMALVFDINLTSPSPDVSVASLWIVLSGGLLALLERPTASELAVLALLAAGALTVKLSLAGLAAAIVPVAIGCWLVRTRPAPGAAIGRLAAIGAGMALLVVPWMVRGIYLSGYPLFPSTIGGVAADWSVPRAAAIAEADLIRYWNGVHDWWWAALRDPRWFLRWTVTLGWTEREPLLPLGLTAIAALALVVRRLWRRGPRVVPLVVVGPTLAALAFCFAAAPRARYGSSGFWVLAAQTVVLALDAAPLAAGRLVRLVPVAAALALGAVPLFDGKPVWRGLTVFELPPPPQLHEQQLATGLVVYVPGSTMCCWDGPFPCTPYPNEALRMRRDGDLGAGFAIDPDVAATQAAAR